MKLIKGILGCALAAGLTTFATVQTQAGLVVNGVVYNPLNVKVKTTYYSSGKLKTATWTSKQVLKDLGYSSQYKLMINTETFDVWTVNKNTLVSNLSSNDVLTVGLDYYISTTSNNNKTYTSSGIANVDFSDGGTNLSDNYFYTSGVYSFKRTTGTSTDNQTIKATQLSGYGYFGSLDQEDTTPVTGSITANGGGKGYAGFDYDDEE